VIVFGLISLFLKRTLLLVVGSFIARGARMKKQKVREENKEQPITYLRFLSLKDGKKFCQYGRSSEFEDFSKEIINSEEVRKFLAGGGELLSVEYSVDRDFLFPVLLWRAE
jgi:hypothetical protein